MVHSKNELENKDPKQIPVNQEENYNLFIHSENTTILFNTEQFEIGK